MPLSVIKGHYRIQNSEPDSDSVHFHPATPTRSPACSLAPTSAALDNITRVEGQTVRLLHPPEDLIFTEA